MALSPGSSARYSPAPTDVQSLVRRLLALLGVGDPQPRSSLTLHFDDKGRLAKTEEKVTRSH